MFEKFKFSEEQIKGYINSAKKDLIISESTKISEVIFTFSYNAFIKIAIAVCAKKGIRVKSKQGHHVALISKFSEILGDTSIIQIGNAMRLKRNQDVYEGGITISINDSLNYYKWVSSLIKQAIKFTK